MSVFLPNRNQSIAMSKRHDEKCLFMNFYWMYISHTLSLANNFISFYFDVDYFPLSVMPLQRKMRCTAIECAMLCAQGEFIIKIIQSVALHHTLVYSDRFIYVGGTVWRRAGVLVRCWSIYCLSCGFEKNFTAICAIKRRRSRRSRREKEMRVGQPK